LSSRPSGGLGAKRDFRHGLLGDAVRQRRAFDQFEDERLRVVRCLGPVDLSDVRVVETGEDLRFSVKRARGKLDRDFLRVETMIEPIKQKWVADSDVQQGRLVWIGHDMKARLTLSVQGVPPAGYNWEAESDVKAGETGIFIRREKRKAHA